MIFGPEMRRQILAGRKTVTRRPVQEPRLVRRANGTTYWTRPFGEHMAGHVVPLQPGRGEVAVAHLLITSIAAAFVGDITYLDARAEGFRTTDAFKAYWVGLYDKTWVAREERDLEQLVARFEARHAAARVWVVAFELTSAPLRYMSAKPPDPGRGAGDYVTSPARALEPVEVVGDDLLERFAQSAREDHAARQAGADDELFAERRSLEERARVLLKAAAERGVDTRDDRRVIERRLDAIEKRIRAQAARKAA